MMIVTVPLPSASAWPEARMVAPAAATRSPVAPIATSHDEGPPVRRWSCRLYWLFPCSVSVPAPSFVRPPRVSAARRARAHRRASKADVVAIRIEDASAIAVGQGGRDVDGRATGPLRTAAIEQDGARAHVAEGRELNEASGDARAARVAIGAGEAERAVARLDERPVGQSAGERGVERSRAIFHPHRARAAAERSMAFAKIVRLSGPCAPRISALPSETKPPCPHVRAPAPLKVIVRVPP